MQTDEHSQKTPAGGADSRRRKKEMEQRILLRQTPLFRDRARRAGQRLRRKFRFSASSTKYPRGREA